MTDARRKAKIVLLQQRKTLSDLAHAARLAEATVHNVLNGRASSRKSRQAITNALEVQIWDHLPVTERRVTIPQGSEIKFPCVEGAQALESEFAAFASRRGRSLLFHKGASAIVRIPQDGRGR